MPQSDSLKLDEIEQSDDQPTKRSDSQIQLFSMRLKGRVHACIKKKNLEVL